MKTFGRIFMIVTAFAIVMSIIYAAVSVNSSASVSGFTIQNGTENFRSVGIRPDDREGNSSAAGIIFGLIKNMVIVTFIVAMVALPKNLMRQKLRAVLVRIR